MGKPYTTRSLANVMVECGLYKTVGSAQVQVAKAISRGDLQAQKVSNTNHIPVKDAHDFVLKLLADKRKVCARLKDPSFAKKSPWS